MAIRLWQKISLLVGMLGFLGHADARGDDVDASVFRTEEAARSYLEANPFGPRAQAAFLALVQFDLARKNPDFSLDEIRTGFARATRRSTRRTRDSSGPVTGAASSAATAGSSDAPY